MTSSPQAGPPPEHAGDKEDLDELFKDAKPYGDGDDWAIQGFFSTDEEQEEFVAWIRAERDKELA